MLGWFRKGQNEPAIQAPLTIPTMPLDLTCAEFVENPYPTFAWLRAHQPVAEIARGGFLLTRYSDIRSALTHPDLGNAPSRFSTLSARNSEKYVAADLASRISPFLDGSAHVEMRQMTSRAFFETLKSFERDVETLAQRYVAELANGDDMITSVCQPFALQVMCEFCGIDADPQNMKKLTQAFFHLFAPLRDQSVFAELNTALSEFRSVIERSLEKSVPQNSLLSAMQRFQGSADTISNAQIIDNCLLVFADGVENIEAAAASLLLLFEEFSVFDPIINGDVKIDLAIREGLRLQTPGQLIPRVARAECIIGGIEIKKDMPVFLALASGNRDETVFDQPDTFDVTRDVKEFLTFGQGRHRCIGEPLAMLQLTSLMRALVDADIRPLDNNVEYQTRIGHRWPKKLTVKRA